MAQEREFSNIRVWLNINYFFQACGSYRLRPKSKQSQEDLDRISKITTDAPIDVGKTGSLGRKTLESLKEIERNRQLHLAKQGNFYFIENKMN